MIDLLSTLVLSSAWPRVFIICVGTGSIDTLGTQPESRTLIAEIANCQSELAAGAPGRFTVHMGGEPFVYEGPLYLDGSRDHVAKSPANGDVTKFRLDLRGRRRLNVELDFFDADLDRLGGVERTSLRCQSLGG